MLRFTGNYPILKMQMQLSFKSAAQLRRGEEAVLERIDLPLDVAQRLMELGFIPGTRISASWSAPSGDPRVFRVDGSEVALRSETAQSLILRV